MNGLGLGRTGLNWVTWSWEAQFGRSHDLDEKCPAHSRDRRADPCYLSAQNSI